MHTANGALRELVSRRFEAAFGDNAKGVYQLS